MARITPTLHPRSRFTSSLFATTVFASFFVVVLPHVLPCPAPRVAYTDDGSCPAPGKRRRRKVIVEQESNPEQPVAMKMLPPSQLTSQMSSITTRSDFTEGPEVEDTQAGMKRGQRECPIPKPGGLVGEILGFRRDKAIEMGSKDEVSSARTIDAVNKIERIANGNGERPP